MVTPKPTTFKKYRDSGAYHWAECDRRSSSYNPPLRARYEAVERRVQHVRCALDAGCGDGYLMARLSGVCDQIFGVEPDAEGVALARQCLEDRPNCSVTRGSCYELPFDAGCFDLVLFADVIEHLEHPDLALRELRRVLVSSGTMLLTTPRRRTDRPLGWNHVREYMGDDLAEELRQHFKVVSLVYLWPRTWMELYSTRIGWRAIKYLCRLLPVNPFLKEGDDPEGFHQILAVCTRPISTG